MSGETYDKGVNGLSDVSGFGYTKGEANIALRDDGTAKHFLMSLGSNDDTNWTIGRHKLVMQGMLNNSTGDFELSFVQYVKYPANGDSFSDKNMILRTHIKGRMA